MWRQEANGFHRLAHAFNSNQGPSILGEAGRVWRSSGNASTSDAAEQLLSDITGRNVEFMRSWANLGMLCVSYF